jgi:hypothetical protein
MCEFALLWLGLADEMMNKIVPNELSDFVAANASAEVTNIATRMLGSRVLAERWLDQPALAQDRRRPLEMLTSSTGIETVTDFLTRIGFGVYTGMPKARAVTGFPTRSISSTWWLDSMRYSDSIAAIDVVPKMVLLS